jgi:class 3 adenylate cyclase/tetratricopeptide (TPR) repeat protein
LVKVCPHCGEENPERFPLCGFCGTPFAAAAAPRETRKTVTVVFSDLVGSTTLGESMDSESLREILRRYFDAMRAVLEGHGGTVEKFIGDAVMAVFGLPKLREDDALRAVQAAVAMQTALAETNALLEEGWGVRLANRTGVNTGEVVAGDITEGQRLVTGDAVNVAARLEQAAEAGGILLGELTYRLVRSAVEVEAVEPLDLKGKAEPVPAYRFLRFSDASAGPAKHDAPIVGRERELELLLEAFEQAREMSTCRLTTVLGAAGMGKSRLVAEFVARVGAQASVLRGRCLSHGRGSTFWPVIEIVRTAAGIRDDDAPFVARAKISAIVGEGEVAERVASVMGLSSTQFPVDEIFWGVRRFLETLAAEEPLVVVLEDIHWAETTMLDLVEHVLDAATMPIVLVGAARRELLEIRPGWDELEGSTAIVLSPLSAEDAALVADNLLGEAVLDDAVRARIVAAAEGNPLFVEQMLSMLIDEGAVRREGGRWVPVEEVVEISVPPTIQALLAARLDLLEPDERAVVEAASVAGLVFPEDAVRELVPDHLATGVDRILGSLARKHFVHPQADPVGSDARYRFDHVLIREAAYQGILKRSRATLHERFVGWADRVNRDRDRAVEFEEILGHHLEQAYRNLHDLGPLDDHGRELGARAAERLTGAGRRAFARGDMPAAANLLRRAADVLPEAAPARLELLPDLGEALMESGEFPWAELFLDEAVRCGDGDGLIPAEAELLLLRVKGQAGAPERWSERLVPAAARAIARFEEGGHHAALARGCRLLAWAHGTSLRYGRAAEAAEQAVEHARLAGDARQRRRAAYQYAVTALHGPTPVPEAIRRCEEIVAEAEGDRTTAGLVRSVLAYLYAMNGDFGQARRLYTDARALLEEVGGTVVAASTSLESCGVERLAGDSTAAERELRRDYAALKKVGEKYFLSTVAAELARVLYDQARCDEADAFSREAEALAAEDDIASQTLWRSVRAKIAAQRGRLDEGLRLSWEAWELIGRTDAHITKAETLVDHAEVLRFAGRDAQADEALKDAVELLDAKGNVVAAEAVRSRFGAPVPGAELPHVAVVAVDERRDPVAVVQPGDAGQAR